MSSDLEKIYLKDDDDLLDLVAFYAFISTIEPKNVKEAIMDSDWVISMQDDFH